MPRTVSNDLFDLIRSMSRNEKIYFKRYAKRHADNHNNNYIRLFDLIDEQPEYNEQKLAARGFPKDGLARTKNYLHKTILETLQNYHAENKVETILKNQLAQVQILFEKTLFDQAGKLVVKTKKLASEYDEFPVLLEALKWEIRLYGNDLNFKRIERINAEQKKIIDKFNEFLEMESLSNIMFGIFRSEGYTGKKVVLDRIEQIIQHPRLQESEHKLTSFLSVQHYHSVFGLYHFITGNFQQAYEYRLKKVSAFDAQPKYITEYFQRYWRSIFEACALCSLLYKEDEFNRLLTKLRHVLSAYQKSISRETHALIEQFIFIYQLQFYNHQGSFEKAHDCIINQYPHLKKSETMLGKADSMTILNLLARAYFGHGKFHESLKTVQLILNQSEQDIPVNIYTMARIIKLLCLYEIQQYDLLDSLMRSTLYHYEKKRSDFKLELTIIRYLQSLTSSPDSKARSKVLMEMRSDLLKLKTEPHQFFSFHDFDFIAWVDAQSGHETFGEIVRQNVRVAADKS
ncbi:MAG: hypothetical protein KDD36_07695 [Flavobacteriales bacterium]|nr:hypothetical protein [Flavobacteriales bacterium]